MHAHIGCWRSPFQPLMQKWQWTHRLYILDGLCRQTTFVTNSCGMADCVRLIWKAPWDISGIHTSCGGPWVVTGDPVSLERKLLAGGRAYVPEALGKCGSQSCVSHAPSLELCQCWDGLDSDLWTLVTMATEVIPMCSRQVAMSNLVGQGWYEMRPEVCL